MIVGGGHAWRQHGQGDAWPPSVSHNGAPSGAHLWATGWSTPGARGRSPTSIVSRSWVTGWIAPPFQALALSVRWRSTTD
jgi:hypothetical protein